MFNLDEFKEVLELPGVDFIDLGQCRYAAETTKLEDRPLRASAEVLDQTKRWRRTLGGASSAAWERMVHPRHGLDTAHAAQVQANRREVQGRPRNLFSVNHIQDFLISAGWRPSEIQQDDHSCC